MLNFTLPLWLLLFFLTRTIICIIHHSIDTAIQRYIFLSCNSQSVLEASNITSAIPSTDIYSQWQELNQNLLQVFLKSSQNSMFQSLQPTKIRKDWLSFFLMPVSKLINNLPVVEGLVLVPQRKNTLFSTVMNTLVSCARWIETSVMPDLILHIRFVYNQENDQSFQYWPIAVSAHPPRLADQQSRPTSNLHSYCQGSSHWGQPNGPNSTYL